MSDQADTHGTPPVRQQIPQQQFRKPTPQLAPGERRRRAWWFVGWVMAVIAMLGETLVGAFLVMLSDGCHGQCDFDRMERGWLIAVAGPATVTVLGAIGNFFHRRAWVPWVVIPLALVPLFVGGAIMESGM